MLKLKPIPLVRQQDKEFLNDFPLIFWLIFVIFGVLLMVPVMIYIGFSAKAFTGTGEGTPDNPYQISNCQQFQEMNLDTDANYMIVTDIDCSDSINWDNGKGFLTIGNFTGVVDGRNHSITDLYINRPDEYAVGIFAFFNGGEIKNVRFLKGVNTQATASVIGGRNVGLIAGELRNNARIFNVHSELDVQGMTYSENTFEGNGGGVGGLTGLNRGTIELSSSSGRVSIKDSDDPSIDGYALGGIAGYTDNYEGDSGSIEDSFFSGTVTTNELPQGKLQNVNCGGLVGNLAAEMSVKTSYSTGLIDCYAEGGSTAIGGLFGYLDANNTQTDDESVQHNFFAGSITLIPFGAAGGITGNVPLEKDLSTNYYDSQRSGINQCSSAFPQICSVVNTTQNPDPEYFFNQDSPIFFSWDQNAFWTINSDDFPSLQVQRMTPDAPNNLLAVISGNNLAVSWDTPPALNGRSENIYDYVIEHRQKGDINWILFDDGESTETSVEIPGLNLSTRNIEIRVRAINDIGNGLYSGIFEYSIEAPSKITGLTGEAIAKAAYLLWAPSPTATDYRVEYRPASSAEWIDGSSEVNLNANFEDDSPAIAAFLRDLSQQTTYEFRVAGVNDGGTGEWSDILSLTTPLQQQYTVTNCSELQNMQNDLAGIYTLANDIDCSDTINWNNGAGFKPIGGRPEMFLGSLIGNNKTISNLYINSVLEHDNTEYNGVGLFAVAYDAVIENVKLVNPTVIGTAPLSEEVDSDQNGLPDIDNPIENPEDIQNITPEELQEDVQMAIIAGNNFNRVGVGTIAGVVGGATTYNNITVENAAVNGGVVGGMFGIIIPDVFLGTTNLVVSSGEVTEIKNSSSSGVVSGIISGGIAGMVISFPFANSSGQSVILNNTSSSMDVDGNAAGGLVGVGFSLMNILQAVSNPQPDMGAIQQVLDSAFSNQGILIINSSASGEISVCNPVTQINAGSLGGLLGLGLGVKIQDSSATGNVTVCSPDPELTGVGVYGGVAGGLAGTLVFSQIDTSSATGQVQAIANDEVNPDQFQILTGVFGGLTGLMISGQDQGTKPLTNKSYATGNVSLSSSFLGLTMSGGLSGAVVGSGTVKDSYATGNINNAPKFGAGVSGGLVGVGIGFDVPALVDAVFMSPPIYTKGLVIDGSYSTGDVISYRTQESFYVSLSGGTAGVVLGNSDIINSRATGSVRNQAIESINAKLFIQPPQNPDESPSIQGGPSPGISIAGGMLGLGVGIDEQKVLATFYQQEIPNGDGIYISNSYSTGDVEGNIAGGLIGHAELKMRVNKTYAEGDVTGTTVGGLVGSSGLGSAAALTATGVTIGFFNSQSNQVPEIVQPLIFAFTDIAGPFEITNTYTTGNVTGRPLRAALINGDTGQPLPPEAGGASVEPLNLPSIAGGIVGFYTSPGGRVLNSYSSGNVSIVSPISGQEAEANLRLPEIPSTAGGVFGLQLAYPEPNLKTIFEKSGSDEAANFNLTDWLGRNMVVENVFSTSKISTATNATTGSVAGFFVSPISLIAQITQQGIGSNDKIYKFNNYYFDRTRTNQEQCNGPSAPRQYIEGVVNDTNIGEVFDPNDPNSAPVLGVYNGTKAVIQNDEMYNQFISPFFAPAQCSPVNTNNSQPNYFINNKANVPLNNWDFNSVWVTRKNDYPKFTAGPEDPNPVPVPQPPTITRPRPVSAPQTPDNQVGGVGTPRPDLANLLNPDRVKGKKDNWLIALVKRIPESVAKTIPFSLLLILIMISLLYSYSALLEKHRRAKLQLLIKRIYASGKARATYISIISHYLNTPLTKMRSVVELLYGTKKITADVNKRASTELSKVAKSTDTLLNMGKTLTMNQQAEIKSLESIKLPSLLSKPAVWLPLAIIFTLTALLNVLFVLADRYDATGMLILSQLAIGAIGGAALVVSFFYLSNAKKLRLAVNRQADVEKSTASQQAQFIQNVSSSLNDELSALTVIAPEITSKPKSDGFKAGLSELTTVVDKMDKVAQLSGHVPGVMWKTDIQAVLKDVLKDIREVSDKANITIQANLQPLPPVNIDEMSLAHLLSAPLDNAVKFSSTGSKVELKTELIDKSVVITVTDHGKGIAEKQLIQLFEPFSRFESTEQFDHQGMGLDLYLCQVITEHYGGSIVLVSEEGKGTTARIKVPASS